MEITKDNFLQELENITKTLKKSCFVGFDAEFTAILSGDCFKHRLFDTNEDRYNGMKSEVSKMIMTQVGLTMFQYDRSRDMYLATSYTFHLCPQVFGDIDQSFIFQASTLRFLCTHGFNFNKFTYEGIPYLSKTEEAQVRQQLKDKTFINTLMQKLTMEEEKLLQNFCSQTAVWLSNSEEDTLYLDVQNPVLRYLVHNEIRNRFPTVLTTDSLGNSNKILIYRDKYVEGAEAAPLIILEENLLSYVLGFSQVIALLQLYNKPIIGHNLILDLVLLHNQFIGPLPNKYSTFKKNINAMLPTIYDTKYISHEMGRKLSFDEVWKSNALQVLYEFFAEGKCRKIQNGSNLISLTIPFNEKQTYHEAGWDSYCSGYCFIRMGHWAASENRGSVSMMTLGPTENLAAMKQFANKINVIRGAVPYMSLVGNDPASHRPDLLHIKTLCDNAINIAKLASALDSFGYIDVKPYGIRTALIATSTHNTADKILKQFRDSREYKISKFNVYRHSVPARVAMWSSAIITGSLVLYLLIKTESRR